MAYLSFSIVKKKKEFKFHSIFFFFFQKNIPVKKTPQTSRYHLPLNFEEQLNKYQYVPFRS